MKGFIIDLIIEVFTKFFQLLKPKSQEAAGPGEREERLRDKIKKDGW